MRIGKLRYDERGNVAVLSAVLLPIMLGVGSLVLEYGASLLAKVQLQRVADLAAYAGANAYAKTSSAGAIAPAAQMVGHLNGVADASLSAQLVASPKGDGSQVVQATISVTKPILLARALGVATDLTVGATAYASVGGGVGSCVIALNSGGAGVTLSGGTSLSAPKCMVASNASIAVPCGATVTAKEAGYAGSVPSAPCGGLKDASGAALSPKMKTTADPLASDAGVAAATGRISTVQAIAAPASPTVPVGKPIEFAWDQTKTTGQATAIGCAATWSAPIWTLTCPNGGTYNFGTFAIGGGITVKFALAASAATKFNFSEKVPLSGSSVQFGDGTYAFSKGVSVGGGTTVTFGAGAFNFGRSPDSCGDGGYYSICHTGASLSFGGPSTFTINSGFNVGGGAIMSLGAGATNSYDIGPSSNGYAITAGGGSKTKFADAAAGLFRLSGNLNVLSGGGSCMTLPAALQHDVKGFFSSAGGTTLGAGVYTVTGHIAFGGGGGGDVSCDGQTVGVKGADVTLVTAGASTYGSGSCLGKAFCVGAGYGTVSLTAPSSGATAKLVVVGPTSAVTAGAAFVQGAGAKLSGAFYFPKGPISMTGGASLANGSGDCLQIIGSAITLAGGTTAASACIGGAASASAVAVIQ